jgi:iron-sulfur cluster insertion protein
VITISDNAKTKIKDLLYNEGNPKLSLRTYVQGGGCSGFSYGFTFDEERAEDDTLIEQGTVRILVDAMSYQYLVGATVDYREDINGSQFVINNPGATSTCGCGSSFSV